MCCFILPVSPVLVKVYDFFSSSMCGHVRQPCPELLINLARTKRSRRLGDRRYATTGVSLKIYLHLSDEWRRDCLLWSIF